MHVGPTKVIRTTNGNKNKNNKKKTTKRNQIKDFESFDIMFFIHSTKQNAGVLG